MNNILTSTVSPKISRGFTRSDTSTMGRWWWTVDKWTLAATAILMALGMMLLVTASPAVADHVTGNAMHFVKRQGVFLVLGVITIFFLSLQTPKNIRRGAVIGYLALLALMALTLLVGTEIKGATRWIYLAGFSLQPSELMKPTFVVITAWMLSAHCEDPTFPGRNIAIGLLAITLSLLILQPDFGMSMVVAATWCAQLFLAGLSLAWVAGLLGAGVSLSIIAYFTLSHVQSRVDRFLDPSSGDTYQIDKALQAFSNGNLFGRGPGEGRVKEVLPDAHTDFIFAVAGEEFGILLCLLLIALFGFIVLRGFILAMRNKNLFTLLAVSGLLIEFGLQAFINMASSLHLIPTKGMTLPFISYGGSSLLGLSLTMGAVLALTRNDPHQDMHRGDI